MKSVLITGGTGLIGERLTDLLLQRGYHVSHLGRHRREGRVTSFLWDIDRGYIDPQALQSVNTIVHLAGAGIADRRWTENRKQEILHSRVDSTRLLYNELKKGGHSVKTFVGASAVGYYGFENPEKIFTEEDDPGKDFLAGVTLAWENQVDALKELGLRVVKLRTGIVLSKKDGVLKEFMRTVKLFVGSPLGSGDQYISWIHIDDHCQIMIKAIEEQGMTGPYNSVAPNPVTNEELVKAIAVVLHKPLWLPNVPSWALRIVLGELADLVLYSSKVSANKIIKAGYAFKFVKVDDAVKDLLQREK